jgi:hypothetical protein
VEPTDGLARRSAEQQILGPRVETLGWLALLLVAAVVSAWAVWLVSPRFDLDTPSFVDDWQAIARSPDQLADVIGLANPEEQRFRPGWIFWNYVQWHTFDAPGGMLGPNFWGVVRIVVLVTGLCLLTWLMLPSARRRRVALLYAAFAGVPALLVVTVPKFARDLAAFGPQEPLLVGGMALGGSLLVLAGRSLVDETVPVRWYTVVLGSAGCALWAFGAYQKETSLAAVPLIVAVLFAGRARLASWRRLSRGRLGGLAALGVVTAVPLAHVAVESLRIILRGDLVYDAEVDGGAGAARGLRELFDWAHEALPTEYRQVALAAAVLTGIVALLRRKVDVLALGALSSGLLALVLAGQSGVVTTRYYIPAFALFIVALAVTLARLPIAVQVVGLVAIGLVVLSPFVPREEVEVWADAERRSGSLVEAVASLESAGCIVAAAGLEPESMQALPVLMAVENPRQVQACEAGGTYFVVGDHGEGLALSRTCERAALEPVLEGGEAMTLARCRRLREEPVRDPELGLVQASDLVAIRRVRPSLDG